MVSCNGTRSEMECEPGTRTPSWYGMVQVCRSSGVTVGVRVRVWSYFEHFISFSVFTVSRRLWFTSSRSTVYDFTIRHKHCAYTQRAESKTSYSEVRVSGSSLVEQYM